MAYAMARFGARYLPRLARYGLRTLRRIPRLFRRRRPMMRKVKKTKNKVHTFIRWCDKDSLYPSASGPSSIVETQSDQNLVYTFKLDNLVNVSDFTNLYDVYKINKVTMYLERASTDSGDGSSAPNNKKMCVVWDDDGDALAGEDAYLEYSNCRRYNIVGQGSIKLTLYPKISTPILNVGGATNAFHSISSSRNWLKIEDDDVPHFGFKIFIPAGVDEVNRELFKVRVKFHMSFKGSK